MSSYHYSSKKTEWKWTPTKIAAFSLFGLVMVALVYFESTSNRNAYSEVVQIEEKPMPLAASSDFDKEYREFISSGQKIVTQATLDSINAVELNNLNPADELVLDVPKTPAPSSRKEQTNSSVETSSTESSAARPNPKLDVVDLSPSPNITSSKGNSPVPGKLEEAEPIANSNQGRTFSQPDNDKVIVEEFYTEETITGTVSALADGTLLKGVKITVSGTDKTATTDSNGRYSITVPGDPQHRTISYSYLGNTTERDVAPGSSVVNVRF
ncbi:MAG: hypothetical protein DHS20C17_20050 [Cyclobacteriaceae bacterium]|nr:MAG: hypothetical protein DHS20C17_20050 [Cyclobacteriaceae bacterium]